MTKPNPETIAQAQRLADRLNAVSDKLNAVCWSIDSAFVGASIPR